MDFERNRNYQLLLPGRGETHRETDPQALLDYAPIKTLLIHNAFL
jgi:hypothetical protein